MNLISNILSFLGFGQTKKFVEKENTAVFTTKFVAVENKDVTKVYHDIEDGSWQFFSNDEFENYEKVAMIVCLGNIIKKDKTLLEISDLPMGFCATRKMKGQKWIIEKTKDED